MSNDRDGSYDYYVNQTKTIANDPKGVGPFILLCIEMERAAKLPAATQIPAVANLPAHITADGDIATLHYTLDRASDVEITLATTDGRVCRQITRKGIPAGAQCEKLDTRHLPAALYLVRLHSGSETKTLKYHKK